MMSTGELSDALNPYVSHSNQHNIHYTQHYQPIVQHAQYHSELELAIAEPAFLYPSPPAPHYLQGTVSYPTQSGIEPPTPVQELINLVSSSRQAQEQERQRRLAWEEEQEVKHTRKQADMEQQMFEMRQELTTLRSALAFAQPPTVPSQYNQSSSVQHPISPISPVSNPSHRNIMFPQGVSTQSMQTLQFYSPPQYDYPVPQYEPGPQRQLLPHAHLMQFSPDSMTPFPSPQRTPVPTSPKQRQPTSNPKKRSSTLERSGDEYGPDSTSESSESGNTRRHRTKRRVHLETQHLTIQHAMRSHLLRVMNIENDKELPDSHVEGTALADSDPVRLVWDKTSKQSVHNSRMKARVIADIKANRRLYKDVPDREFLKKQLESAFDQSFTALRTKFKTQRNPSAAKIEKQREDVKALKSRHLLRRKTKLSNRSKARMNMDEFTHVTFDGALQIDCMSSEESDGDDYSQLCRRGLPWRSTRLEHFFEILDQEECEMNKIKRGSGKKPRRLGSPKEGFHLPPKGIASWMISKQWIASSQEKYPDLPLKLKRLVDDSASFDWNQHRILGDESEDEHPSPPPTQH